jgi:hypothetical protein
LRRKNVKGDALIGLVLIVADPAIATLVPVLAFVALIPSRPRPWAWRRCGRSPASASGSASASASTISAGRLFAVAILIAAAALILETGPALAQHAEIMVRELQVIFSLHAVAAELRVARRLLYFRSWAALPRCRLSWRLPPPPPDIPCGRCPPRPRRRPPCRLLIKLCSLIALAL